MLKPGDIVVKGEDVVARFLEDRAILLHPDSRHPFRLNEVGTRIWELMDRHNRIEDLIEALSGVYEIDRDQAFPDIMAFLEELLKRNLIRTT